MQTLSLKRDSWHYKLAKFYNWEDQYKGYDEQGFRVWRNKDFCSYVRHILIGTALFVMGTILFFIVGVATFFSLGQAIWWVVSCIWNWYHFPLPEEATIGLAILIVMSAAGIILFMKKYGGYILSFIGWVFTKLTHRINIPDCKDIPLCDDTRRFFVAAYTTFHDKVCFKLEFRNGDSETEHR